MIDPRFLCEQHLLGEHGEIHKFRHSFVKQHNMTTRIRLGQIEPVSMQARHDALAAEMLRRGMNHRSPYVQPDVTYIPKRFLDMRVNTAAAMADLFQRCPACFVQWLSVQEAA